MSRRIARTITIQLRLPLPPGHKPADVVADLRETILKGPAFKGFENQVTVQIVKRETTYL